MQPLPLEQLIGALRSALHYLYDPVHLRSSPLVPLLGLTEESDRAVALQTQLTAAARALKPADNEDPQSRAWRVYDLLHFQYIRQLSREAVATQLGISMRQLRREQRIALEVLAQQLQLPLDQIDLTPVTHPALGLVPHEPPAATDEALNEELGWLKKGAGEATVPLRDALQMVWQLVRPLAERWQVELQLDVAVDLAALPVRPLALRSILLTILSVAIPRAGKTPLTLAAALEQGNLTIRVITAGGDVPPLTEAEVASLQTAEKLATFHHAHLELPQGGVTGDTATGFVATLTLPQPTQLQILVIDDNPDWIELQQRYVSNTRYQVIGTSDSIHAAGMAAHMQPAAILLDVMIQAVDGWQILSELRYEPTTAGIPVVICTILPVADLALALGADAFLHKPVSQDHYLEMLARWSG